MPIALPYNREAAVRYADRWALSRNPRFLDFARIGGDCTNFASQCIYEGCKIMNYSNNGWYYRSSNDKSPSWSSVEFLYKFLIKNKSYGPRGKEVSISEIKPGDIAQLSFNGNTFGHSLFIIDINGPYLNNISFVCSSVILLLCAAEAISIAALRALPISYP